LLTREELYLVAVPENPLSGAPEQWPLEHGRSVGAECSVKNSALPIASNISPFSTKVVKEWIASGFCEFMDFVTRVIESRTLRVRSFIFRRERPLATSLEAQLVEP
jgi:hypothetical protein